MSKLGKIEDLLLGLASDPLCGTDYDAVAHTTKQIKDLIRDLIDETFDKDDAKAYELWQKVEKL